LRAVQHAEVGTKFRSDLLCELLSDFVEPFAKNLKTLFYSAEFEHPVKPTLPTAKARAEDRRYPEFLRYRDEELSLGVIRPTDFEAGAFVVGGDVNFALHDKRPRSFDQLQP
jgi:hypothetical protein